ncbi:FHA domain-containing protein [Embleya scabrispora]|uniref:FHA domain-containing protein n=1 Tax=Embleya scabrispora TaxID=159449 RepID=UPI0003807DAA|nr:FHA domain-containing protein [Embleya scabrispora]MYS84303.1 FHA domain-containing protein [Streptomyces sp. SID5474]
MHICPIGHPSTAADYCDECGRPMPAEGDVPYELDGPGPGGSGTSLGVLTCRFCATEYTADDQFCEGCGHEVGTLTGGSPPIVCVFPDPEEAVLPFGASSVGTSSSGTSSTGTSSTGTSSTGTSSSDKSSTGTSGSDPVSSGQGSGTVWTARVVPDHDYFLRVLEWDGPDAHSMRFPHEQEPWTLKLTGESMRIGRRNSSVSSAPPEVPIDDPGVSRRHAMLLRCGDGTWEVMDLGSANGTTINAGYDRVRRDPVHLKDGDRVHVGAWTTLEIRRVDL